MYVNTYINSDYYVSFQTSLFKSKCIYLHKYRYMPVQMNTHINMYLHAPTDAGLTLTISKQYKLSNAATPENNKKMQN